VSLQDNLNALLPEDWALSNLINLDPGWQVNATNGEHVVVATGADIESACALACHKIDIGDFAGRLFHLERMKATEPSSPEGKSLLQALGFKPKAQPVLRRL
jgi:hypothetical protein